VLGQENIQNPGVLVEGNASEKKTLDAPSLSEVGYHRHLESDEDQEKRSKSNYILGKKPARR
jgi:hypothetical protein